MGSLLVGVLVAVLEVVVDWFGSEAGGSAGSPQAVRKKTPVRARAQALVRTCLVVAISLFFFLFSGLLRFMADGFFPIGVKRRVKLSHFPRGKVEKVLFKRRITVCVVAGVVFH